MIQEILTLLFSWGMGGHNPPTQFFPPSKIFNLQFLQIKHLNNFGTQIFQDTKEGARSELYYTAQIAVTCSQITVQTTSVF